MEKKIWMHETWWFPDDLQSKAYFIYLYLKIRKQMEILPFTCIYIWDKNKMYNGAFHVTHPVTPYTFYVLNQRNQQIPYNCEL